MSFTTIYSTFQLLYASITIEVFPDETGGRQNYIVKWKRGCSLSLSAYSTLTANTIVSMSAAILSGIFLLISHSIQAQLLRFHANCEVSYVKHPNKQMAAALEPCMALGVGGVHVSGGGWTTSKWGCKSMLASVGCKDGLLAGQTQTAPVSRDCHGSHRPIGFWSGSWSGQGRGWDILPCKWPGPRCWVLRVSDLQLDVSRWRLELTRGKLYQFEPNVHKRSLTFDVISPLLTGLMAIRPPLKSTAILSHI